MEQVSRASLQVNILTQHQKDVLNCFNNTEYLTQNFYFTGGTALSEHYLQHRLSEDLDFFSDNKVDVMKLEEIVAGWTKQLDCSVTNRLVDPVYIYYFEFKDGAKLKVDFANYPYKRQDNYTQLLDTRINVDSLKDIATNKFLTISQRNDVKDFVDLYYLMKDYGFVITELTDYKYSKFSLQTDFVLLAYDFMKINRFEFLPQMLKPLTLTELKNFYNDLAQMIIKPSLTS